MKLNPWVPITANSYSTPPDLFDYKEFRSVVFARGTWFWWQYGLHCPCDQQVDVGLPDKTYNIAPYRAKVVCPVCNGEGVMFEEGQYIPAIVATYKEMSTVSSIFANLEIGDIFVSVLREHSLDYLDRLVLLSDPIVVSEKVQKENSDPIRLRHPVVPKRLYVTDEAVPDVTPTACSSTREVRVIHARWADSDGVVQPGELVEGTDIIVDDATGTITAPGIPVGAWISLRYHTYQVFRVGGALRQSRSTPMVGGCLLPEEGDGPVQYILKPQKMGLGAKHNPSATYLPPRMGL